MPSAPSLLSSAQLSSAVVSWEGERGGAPLHKGAGAMVTPRRAPRVRSLCLSPATRSAWLPTGAVWGGFILVPGKTKCQLSQAKEGGLGPVLLSVLLLLLFLAHELDSGANWCAPHASPVCVCVCVEHWGYRCWEWGGCVGCPAAAWFGAWLQGHVQGEGLLIAQSCACLRQSRTSWSSMRSLSKIAGCTDTHTCWE